VKIKFTRLVFLLLLTVSLQTFFISGQSRSCEAKLSDLSPISEFDGFSIGMTEDSARSIYKEVVIPEADAFGLSRTSFSPEFSKIIDKHGFSGVRTVSLEFLDGRISSIWFGFQDGFKWRSVDEATAGLSSELHLPPAWQRKGREQQLTCSDFSLGVSSVAGWPSIRIIDLSAKSILQARRENAVEPSSN
jgi:hypothetical protein